MISKLLFDLDGTLTDPKEGICKSVQYALRAFGIEEPDIDKLEPFIGPPLVDSFMQFYGMTKERAAEAVVKYRERFSVRGWSENIVYEGIPHMLQSLRDAGYVLAVASSKPTVFVERILTHFGLRDAFSVVVGSELDGRRINKDEVILEALRQLFGMSDGVLPGSVSRGGAMQYDAIRNDAMQGGAPQVTAEHEDGQDSGQNGSDADGSIRYDELLMIGDRKFDVEGAHALGIRCVGVAYGYAQPGELEEAGADFLADSPDRLSELLLELRGKDSDDFNDAGNDAGRNAGEVCKQAGCSKKRESRSNAEGGCADQNAVDEKSGEAAETKGGKWHA